MKKIIMMMLLLCLMVGLSSTIIHHKIKLTTPQVDEYLGYVKITMDGTSPFGQVGQPELPAYAVKYLLPRGEKLDKVIITGQKASMQIHRLVFPVQKQVALSKLQTAKFITPDPKYYTGIFPSHNYENADVNNFRGHQIGSFLLRPIVYDTDNKLLTYFTAVNLEIHTVASDATTGLAPRNDAPTVDVIKNLVINPHDADYGANRLLNENDYDYLIITNAEMQAAFQVLADYKNSLGIKTKIALLEDIYASQNGADRQEKIRNFITVEYYAYNISYLLLGGDDNVLPHRGFYISIGNEEDDTETDMPSDMYYTNLDGTWNDDNDSRWGEFHEKDLIAEIYGGRATVDNLVQAANFVRKQISYQATPVVSSINNTLMLGEELGWVCMGKDYMEEIRLGSNHYGYTTGPLPAHHNVQTMYDDDAIWSKYQLKQALNNGMNMVNHLGHAYNNSSMKLDLSDVTTASFTNDGINEGYWIVFSQGCYAAAFDNRGTNGQYFDFDAIMEQLSYLSTGPVGILANTRYGLGDGGGTNGASQHFHREFNDAIYTEGITNIARALEDSRLDTSSFITTGSGLLWACYTLNYFGDPSLDIWTNTPAEVTLTLPDNIAIGSTSLSAQLSSDIDPAGMRVAVHSGNVLLGSTVADNTGSISIEFIQSLTNLNPFTVVLSGHNITDHTYQLDVVPAETAYIVPSVVNYSDSNNNILEWNEEAYFNVNVINRGATFSDSISAIIFTDSPYVTVLDNEAHYRPIGSGLTASSINNFKIKTATDVPPHTEVVYTLMIFEGVNFWEYEFTSLIEAPVFQFEASSFTETTGNNNGIIEPGEICSPDFNVSLEYGEGLAAVNIALFTDNPAVTITPSSISYTDIADNASLALNQFSISLDESILNGSNIVMYLGIRTDREYAVNQIVNFQLAQYTEQFEAMDDWTHSVLQNGYNDQWHRSSRDNHTTGGQYCYKSGSTGNSNYTDDIYAGLVTSPINYVGNGKLSFWHRMGAELDAAHPGVCYDGAYVQVSADNGPFIAISPSDGYPYTMSANNQSSFSGTHGWEKVIFNLSEITTTPQTVRFRFIFETDSYTTGEGWYIDDVQLSTILNAQTPSQFLAEQAGNKIHLSWQSPSSNVSHYIIKRNNQTIADHVMTSSFVDASLLRPGRTYTYKIASVNDMGTSLYSTEIAVFMVSGDDNVAPQIATGIRGNYPNPFNPTTTIKWAVADNITNAKVKLKVYNIKGQSVKSLFDDHQSGGTYSRVWNGQDDNGKTVASGVYFYRLQVNNAAYVGKMLLMK